MVANECEDPSGDPHRTDARVPFGKLYARWGSVVEAAAEPYVRSHADAEDAKQNVFLRLWRTGGWETIRDPNAFFRVAGAREGISMRRAQARRRSLWERLDRSRPPTPEDELAALEARAASARLLDRLPSRCRLVMQLILFEDLTQPEVAEQLGISIGGVEKQVARGRRLLRGMSGSSATAALVSSLEDGGGGEGM